MEEQGSHRVMVVTDVNLTESEPVAVTLESLHTHGIDAVLFDQVRAVKQPLVPHGMAVVLDAPAVFKFTASADPELHLYAAKLMGKDVSDDHPDDAGEILASAIVELMKKSRHAERTERIGLWTAGRG
jgi:alcohol dehydrogenase class IV